MKVVYIEWLDSYGISGWHDYDCLDVPACKSIGYLLEENKDKVVICQSYSEAGQKYSILAIPKCSIKKRKTIK